jgi:hypothetical protein
MGFPSNSCAEPYIHRVDSRIRISHENPSKWCKSDNSDLEAETQSSGSDRASEHMLILELSILSCNGATVARFQFSVGALFT